jgi:pimeloyl-ACP methyl ester carboxylesterase
MRHVLLSGWAQPADALLHLAPDALAFDYSLYGSADEAIKALKAQNPSHIIAWSLGGQLALRALAKGALHLKHLTLIAAPMQFVSDESLKGMDATTYQLFRDSYASDPIRTKARLHALIAKGDRETKQVMAMLSHHAKVDEVAHWLPWLEDLAAHRLDIGALASAPPTLIIHGMNDAIVPFEQSEALVKRLPRAELMAWAEVGHAPHMHDSQRMIAEISAHRQRHGAA